MIYFAQPTNGGPIRIGASKAMNERLRTLGTWLPGGIETIIEMDGYFLGEAILHRCFDPIRVERDWFRSCPEIWQFIISLKSGRPSWLPAEEATAPKFAYEQILQEFGGIDGAVSTLGYNSAASLSQSAKSGSSLGFGFASRVYFARLLKAGDLPEFITSLHVQAPSLLQEAA